MNNVPRTRELWKLFLHYQLLQKIGELLSSAHASEKATNRQCLLKILSNLRFFARQGCAIRGHGDETDSNYYQLLKLRSEDDKKVAMFYTVYCIIHS